MKVESVVLKLREGYKLYGINVLSFHEADFPELHYMAKEGQHIVNFKASDGRREGKSFPMTDVAVVDTVL